MDEDIRTNLKEVATHIHDVARQIDSTWVSIESLIGVNAYLKNAVDVIETYMRIQANRDKIRMETDNEG